MEDLLNQNQTRNFQNRSDDFNKYTDIEFPRRYRLQKNTVRWLVTRLQGILQPSTLRNQSISPTLQILTAIRLMAGGTIQHICADLCFVSQSSVSRIFLKVVQAICTLRAELIAVPQDLSTVKHAFYQYGLFPGVIVALMALTSLSQSLSSLSNWKCFHAEKNISR